MTAGEIAASGRAALVTWLCEVDDRARARINRATAPEGARVSIFLGRSNASDHGS